MVERFFGPVLGHRLLFLALAAALFFLRLLPINAASEAWPGPDFLLCLVFAWSLRRPDFLPFWLVALVIFLEDLLLMRPPGLWAALVVVGVEFLRNRTTLTRELNFGVEWILVSTVMAALFLANRLIFAFALLPQTPVSYSLVQLAGTVLFYPAVVALSRLAFGLRKPAMGEVDAIGRRI